MRTIVSKFGGSSTADADCFKQVLSIVRQNPARQCIVLSAPGINAIHREKVTALLEKCWHLRWKPDRLGCAVAKVVERFTGIAEALSLYDVKAQCEREIMNALYLSRAHTLSRGEYLCAWLFSEYSGLKLLDASGLIAFDGALQLDERRTLDRLGTINNSEGAVVLPGFYGSDPSGHIVLFPSNGSDITGALAAAGMEAGLYENWSDVPGLMTADPAIVPDARLIPQVSYRQMRQLSRAGARILHPACLDPVAMAGIPTRLRCTRSPESFGTLIDEKYDRIAPCMAGVKTTVLPEATKEEQRCARISLFGLRLADILRASQSLTPLLINALRDQTDVYVKTEDYEASMRLLHHRLLE